MQFGLKNRLRVISLLPIIVLFTVTSYYVYGSYVAYQAAHELQNRLNQNIYLNEIIGDIARERGMSAMYLGNKTKNILKSLKEQRKIVDKEIAAYIDKIKKNETLHNHSLSDKPTECTTCKNIDIILKSMNEIRAVRPLIDKHEVEFKQMFNDTYGAIQQKLIKQLEQITKNQVDKEISELYSLYISMVDAKEASGVERGYMSYIISRSTQLTRDDLNRWILLIGKADALNYEGVQNRDILKSLDAIFKKKETKELFDDINSERTAIITLAKSGNYDISSGIWFTMLSEKINIISDAETLLLNAMDNRAKKVQQDSLRILIITLVVWLIAIILALLGYLLSNEIAANIKHLENVLKKVAQDYNSQKKKINLHTSEGTNLAYELLEEIIEQTKRDKISAQEASEAKSMFLANMSHEIRTPLNGIVGFTELLKDSGLEEEQIEFVDIIEKSSENLLEIINNILDLSKIESNKLEIEHIPFNPVLEFESAVEVYAVRASEKSINLGCFVDPALDAMLKGDPTKLKEVLINLLSNAVKFTHNNGFININIRKLDSDNPGTTKIKFEIQDSGIGISEEQMSRIFEAFNQADLSITRKYGGTGLGLTISSNFVEMMGGKLELTSIPDNGTTFFFTLEFENSETAAKNSKKSFEDIKILILDNPYKSKKQDEYLLEYLDYFGVKYKKFVTIDNIKSLKESSDYNLLFVDYEYTTQEALVDLTKLEQEVVILTKSNLMKKIDALGFDLFKILYEPLHSSKIKQLLENYAALHRFVKKSQDESLKPFDIDKSKFEAEVLIAEDNTINQKLIKRTLEDLGLSVTIADNGLEAFEKRKEKDFDLIFMDIQMPILDGVEATAEILEWEKRNNKVHVPIIALTANALKGDKERFLEAGLDEYTTKPLMRSEIINLLNRFLYTHIVESEDEKDLTKYKADILIAKESAFEIKLYTKMIEEIDDLTYETTTSFKDFEELIRKNSYKIILLDKELAGSDNLEDISLVVKKRSSHKRVNSHVILIDESSKEEDLKHDMYVDEVIDGVVNKDLLKSIFSKYI